MEMKEACKQCEKFELHVHTTAPILGALELPNTYSKKTKKYAWKHTDMMAYLLVPRSVQGTEAAIDMFLCLDEDLIGEIDLRGYATKFLKDTILPEWKNIREFSFAEPVLGSPLAIPCWKEQHQQQISELHIEVKQS